MDDGLRALKGSPVRDAFKHWHKTLDRALWACDVDFLLLEKDPPGIVAALDFKLIGSQDRVTFTEVLAYNHFLRVGIPVFIVWSCPPFEKFSVQEYLGGDHRPDPPDVELGYMLLDATAREFELWEEWLRRAHKLRMEQKELVYA